MAASIKKKYVKDEDYVTSKWGQHTNYECGRCQFKTIDPDKMNAHLDAKSEHAKHPFPAVDPENEELLLNGRHPKIARRLAGQPEDTEQEG